MELEAAHKCAPLCLWSCNEGLSRLLLESSANQYRAPIQYFFNMHMMWAVGVRGQTESKSSGDENVRLFITLNK